MTVLQSVCSHGHMLQFGDVQQAFDTGDLIEREQPLFGRMPPDGVPGVSHEVWVQLLKTVNGLADGTREWTVRGLGCETSVSEPCVSVLRGSQRRYHGIIGVAVDDIAGGGDEGGQTGQGSHRSRTACLQNSCGSSLFCVLR